MSGLAETPGFASDRVSASIFPVRRRVDALLRKVFRKRDSLQNMGSAIGQQRWANAQCAATPEEAQQAQGGRPSKVNGLALVELVRERLHASSQSSSRICAKGSSSSQEWHVVRTLTKDANAIYDDEPDLFCNMSQRTMKRLMKKHLSEYKPAWNEGDWRQYCYDLDKKAGLSRNASSLCAV